MHKFLFAAILASAVLRAEPLPAYNTYLSPPFVIGDGGLAADTVAYLNKKLGGRFELRLDTVQRAKLNYLALDNAGFKGVVLFMSPMFVADESKTKYLWTGPMFTDGNVVLYPAGKRFDFNGPESFDGHLFVGVMGNKYAALDTRAGVKRVDGVSEEAAIKKLLSGEGDATVMAHSVAVYLMGQPLFKDKVVAATKPYSSFTRHVLVGKANPALAAALADIVKGMDHDADWKAIEARYGL